MGELLRTEGPPAFSRDPLSLTLRQARTGLTVGGAPPSPGPTFRPRLQDAGVAALILQISHVGLREGIDKPSVPQPVKGKPPPGEHVQAGTWGT